MKQYEYFSSLIERARKNQKYFKNYLKYARIIKRVAKKELKEVKVYVFGSIVKNTNLPSSDIDILIVSKNMPKKISDRSRIKAKIWKEIGIFSPFEIHLVNEEEFKWYEKSIDKKVMV